MAAPAKVSKNAREGKSRRSVQRKHYCEKGHEQERVKVVPVFGRTRMFWRCECGLS